MKKEIYDHFQQPEVIAKMVTETIKEVQSRKKSLLKEKNIDGLWGKEKEVDSQKFILERMIKERLL